MRSSIFPQDCNNSPDGSVTINEVLHCIRFGFTKNLDLPVPEPPSIIIFRFSIGFIFCDDFFIADTCFSVIFSFNATSFFDFLFLRNIEKIKLPIFFPIPNRIFPVALKGIIKIRIIRFSNDFSETAFSFSSLFFLSRTRNTSDAAITLL